ncbi:hypothetical protein C8N24_2157 [Solirubrobacter pauli]|uniref:Uncharacterized protein n=1 Tax=Solirubrobacter pauli TaxID=166793 RepID=A0A660LBC7_9ACTN|nr:hypothetical protein [Solirubrobacter pauli]RKQ92312.1 hypothetical protein C8N24_2157 [Solirubrobacter pauli]
MSRLSNFIPRPRLAAWLAFGATGLATGAVWATGFATVSAGNGTTGGSPALTKTDAVDDATALSTTASPVSPIVFDWDGRWGKVTAPKVMFKVDLSDPKFADPKRYNVAILLTNVTALTGWATLQLELEHVEKAAGGTCAAADFDGTKDPKLLNVDNQDAGVYWNTLEGEKVHCFGIGVTPSPVDYSTTFLRSAQDTPPSVFPSFVATVDRAL